MDIDFDYYRIFYYVAKTGSFTRAAAALTRSQPNVTRTVKLLESQLGCTLFVRTGRGVRLTGEGEALFSHVRIAMEHLESGQEELTASRTFQSGTVTIGASEVALRCFLLPVLNRFHRSHPNIRLRILNCSAREAMENLRSGTVDIAIARVPPEAVRDLSADFLCDVPEVAVCSDAFAHLAGSPVSAEQLAACPIISLGAQTLMYPLYQSWFAAHGAAFSPEIEVATSGQILPIAEHGLGIGILPAQYCEDAAGIHILELTEPIPSQALYYLRRKDLPLNAAGRRLEEMILSAQGGDGE